MPQTIVATSRPAYQAYQILYVGFIVAPFLAGLDKFTHILTDWDRYLAPVIAGMLPVSVHTFMLFVGLVEMTAAVLVAVRPRLVRSMGRRIGQGTGDADRSFQN